MAATRGLTPELLEPFVTRIFFKTYDLQPLMYPMLFNTTPSSGAFEEFFGMAALERFQVKPEGVPVAYSDPVQGDRKRITMVTFALAFRVTMEMMEDDQHGIISRMSGDLAEAARDSQERLAWGLINDGFTGNTYTGLPEGDGTRRSLWNTSHVFLRNNGNTWSNRVNPAATLSVSGLESALTLFDDMQGEEERYITVTPQTLLVPTALRWLAATILDSTSLPGSSDNDINPVSQSRIGLQTMVVPYLTDDDNWSVWGPKGQHSVTYWERKGLTLNEGSDSQTFDRFYTAHYRTQVDFNESRGTVGSAP